MTACFIDSYLEHGNFLNTDVLQGSVVTYLRCGGMVNKSYLYSAGRILRWASAHILGTHHFVMLGCGVAQGMGFASGE